MPSTSSNQCGKTNVSMLLQSPGRSVWLFE